MELPEVNWVLGDGYKATDRQLTEADIYTLPKLIQQDTIRYDYNQWKQNWSKASCSIFQAVWAMSDLWNYEYSLEEIKEIDDESYNRGRIKWDWWYTRDATALVCEFWNERHPDKPTAYYAVPFSNDDKCNMIMDKNYNLSVSFNYTADYLADYDDNWQIDRAKKWQKKLIGHCVNEIKKNWKKMIKDNYKGSKSQYYVLNVKNSDLYNAGIFHTRAYVYTKVGEDLEELKRLEKVKTACLNALENNSNLRHNTNDETLKNKLHELNEYIRNNNLKYIEQETQRLRW